MLEVLILIVVDNGLVRNRLPGENLEKHGLNPYCSGQWSRTMVLAAVNASKTVS